MVELAGGLSFSVITVHIGLIVCGAAIDKVF